MFDLLMRDTSGDDVPVPLPGRALMFVGHGGRMLAKMPGGQVVAVEGAQGPAGPAGADGAQGPAGPAGQAGADGVWGLVGADGAQGPAGPAGADGAQGPAGPAGQAGADGAQGPAGPAGQAGADGAQGPAGPAGPAGQAGADGAQGPAGPAGPAGADGAQGPAGPAGPAGADGLGGGIYATDSRVQQLPIGASTGRMWLINATGGGQYEPWAVLFKVYGVQSNGTAASTLSVRLVRDGVAQKTIQIAMGTTAKTNRAWSVECEVMADGLDVVANMRMFVDGLATPVAVVAYLPNSTEWADWSLDMGWTAVVAGTTAKAVAGSARSVFGVKQ